MKALELHVKIYKDGKYYTAQCLDVDVATFGKTIAEAKKNIKEALELYFEDDLVETDKQSNREVRTLKLEYA